MTQLTDMGRVWAEKNAATSIVANVAFYAESSGPGWWPAQHIDAARKIANEEGARAAEMNERITLRVVADEDRTDDAPAGAPPLTAKWCDCDEDTGFRCYPEDGACSCGVFKHHVHGMCGHVTQVG